jgi:glycosyltransferase involved in cell wall biosynthesis
MPISNSNELYVVIPAFNEGACIGGVVAGVRREFSEARVVVVDDGSADRTVGEATAAGAFVISLPFNCGYGTALQTGLLYAQNHGATMVVTMDADGQHEAAEIPKLIAPLHDQSADLTLGSRYLPGSQCYPVPLSRRWGSSILSRLVSLLMGRRVCDTTTGFQGLNAKALAVYQSMPDFPEKTPDADLLLYAHMRGCRVVEVPVTMHADVTGDSMHGLYKSLFYIPKMFVSLLSIMLAYRFSRR